jgi:dethiobiotin synthetase
MKGYFITGTDTEVGKTYVTCLLAKHFIKQGISNNVSKPISAGCDVEFENKRVNDDAYRLMLAVNSIQTIEQINPFAYQQPIAPHLAAKSEGAELTVNQVKQAALAGIDPDKEITLIEGAGGWLVPLNHQETFSDLAVSFGLPVILVVSMKLGCINHALLSKASIEQHGLPFAGWIANCMDDSMPFLKDNIATLTEKMGEPLALIKKNQQQLSELFV